MTEHDYSSENFRTPNWIHSVKWDWWAFDRIHWNQYKDHLTEIGLYRAIRATQYDMDTNASKSFTILELYYP